MKNVLLSKFVVVAMLISGFVACGDAGDSVDVDIPEAPVASTVPAVDGGDDTPTPPPTDGPMTQEEMAALVASLPDGAIEAMAELAKSKQKTRTPKITHTACPEDGPLPAYGCTTPHGVDVVE